MQGLLRVQYIKLPAKDGGLIPLNFFTALVIPCNFNAMGDDLKQYGNPMASTNFLTFTCNIALRLSQQ